MLFIIIGQVTRKSSVQQAKSIFIFVFAHSESHIFTGRNEVVAKVMFLQVCVCPQGGEGVCLSACWDAIPPPGPGRPPPGTTETPPGPGRHPPGPGRHPPGPGRPLPWIRQTPQDQGDPPPPGSRLQQTVYQRPVRILLECILV